MKLWFLVLLFPLWFASDTYTQAAPLLRYLKQHKIEHNEDMRYVILSRNSCLYCSKTSAETLRSIKQCENVLIITGDPELQKDLRNSFSVLLDEDYDFDYLPYNFYDSTILRIEDNAVKLEVFGLKEVNDFKMALRQLCE